MISDGTTQPAAVVYCTTSEFRVDDAYSILFNPDKSKLSSLPPANPVGGQVFAYSTETSLVANWRLDGISWRSTGVRKYPVENPTVRVRYFELRHGAGFFRRSYSLVEDSPYEVVFYSGDCTKAVRLPKNNYKNHSANASKWSGNAGKKGALTPKRPRSATSDNRQADGIISSDDETTDDANETSREEASIQRCRSDQSVSKRIKLLHVHDAYASLQVAHTLQGYVWEIQVYPRYVVGFGLRALTEQLQNLPGGIRTEDMYLSYGSSFKINDFYLSSIVYRHAVFNEAPVIPMCFLIYDSKTPEVHSIFFQLVKKTFPFLCEKHMVIVAGREKPVADGIRAAFPNWTHLVCWDQILNDAERWLKTYGGKRRNNVASRSQLIDLMSCASVELYEKRKKALQRSWSRAFTEYFDKHLDLVIKEKANRWVLEELDLYSPGRGITGQNAVHFHSLLNKILRLKKTTTEELLVALYYLQRFYLSEIVKAKSGMDELSLPNGFSLNENQEIVKEPAVDEMCGFVTCRNVHIPSVITLPPTLFRANWKATVRSLDFC